jgi:hypothetical protein
MAEITKNKLLGISQQGIFIIGGGVVGALFSLANKNYLLIGLNILLMTLVCVALASYLELIKE